MKNEKKNGHSIGLLEVLLVNILFIYFIGLIGRLRDPKSNCLFLFHLAIEKLLSSSAGKYCVGDEITLADCCLVPQIFNARRFHVDLRPFPTILRIDRHLENHPAFTAAHPNNQPDCPPEATK